MLFGGRIFVDYGNRLGNVRWVLDVDSQGPFPPGGSAPGLERVPLQQQWPGYAVWQTPIYQLRQAPDFQEQLHHVHSGRHSTKPERKSRAIPRLNQI
jgi:hypothetical protein